MELKLKNGAVISGDAKQLTEILKEWKDAALDEERFYLSESHGLIEIDTMAPMHIKYAICKLYRGWIDNLNTLSSLSDFIAQLKEGPNSKTILALISALAKNEESHE